MMSLEVYRSPGDDLGQVGGRFLPWKGQTLPRALAGRGWGRESLQK